MIKKEYKKLKYIISLPDGYEEGKKYPVIFFLHGAGTRGDDFDKLAENPYFEYRKQRDKFPFITVAPQCYADTWFEIFEQIIDLAKFVYNADFTDKSRFYGMGVSMGGYGIWQLAMTLPQIFAAIVPLCGGGMYWNAARLKDVPVWAFHGADDDVVLCTESRKMTDAVNKCGGSAKLTVFEDCMHNCWNRVYAEGKAFDWLLENTNKGFSETEKLDGSKDFG